MPECDYYTNPTILSQCIRMDDYAAASRRLAKHPEEATVWVCRRVHLPPQSSRHQDSPTKVAIYQPTAERQVITTSRTLPIHIVLSKQTLPQQHKDRNELLAGLITTYPECCHRRAPNGRYILETLIEEHATTQIISLALAACPIVLDKILVAADVPCRIRRLVQRGRPFWEKVRAYAHMTPRNDESDSVETKTNISLKSNGIQDLKTLEQRCLTLERLLLTVNAENYELQQEITRKDQIINEMKEDREESLRAVHNNHIRPVQEEPQLDVINNIQPPARRQYYTNTIVSSLSVDQTRFPFGTFAQQEITRKDQIIKMMKEGREESLRAVHNNQRPVQEEPQLDIIDNVQPPPRRQYSTNTIVSSLSVDQTRYLFGTFAHGNENEDDEDDEDTTALIDAICRPMSPLDQIVKKVEKQSGDCGGLPWIPNLDETVTSADDDDITMDTILQEAELWNGRKLSPSVIRAWNQIPAVKPGSKPERVIRSPHSVA